MNRLSHVWQGCTITLMRLIRWTWGLALTLLFLAVPSALALLAGETTVGMPLDWRVLDEAELGNGYVGVMLVADWDKDGASEALIPRWGGPGYQAPEMINRRCDIIELDGTVKPTGLIGEPLGNSSVIWDYTGDGVPEIACDSRQRGGLAYDQWYADKADQLARKLEQRLAPLRQRQQELQNEIQRLREQGGNAQRLNELQAEDDTLFQQIDDLRFGDEFSLSQVEKKDARGFFVRNDTSIYNLAGKEIAKLPGRRRPEGQHLLGNFTSKDKQQLMLGPAYYSREVEPMRAGGQHKLFSSGGKLVAKWQELASLTYMVAGDVDGDGLDEIVGHHLGLAPYASPLIEIATFDPAKPLTQTVVLRLPTDTPGAWPVACLDWSGDGRAEIILANGMVYNPASKKTWQLDIPPLVRPSFLRNATAPSIIICDLDGLAQPELWAVVERTQLACYTLDGSLVHYEDLGERIMQLAVAVDAHGQHYLLVQLESRILLWRVEPQGASTTMA
jgi:hypothetical protein